MGLGGPAGLLVAEGVGGGLVGTARVVTLNCSHAALSTTKTLLF